MEITTLGLDLAKNVFQVHGTSSTGEVVVRRLRRAQVMLINGMTSIVARNAYRPGVAEPRVAALLARKPLRVATVAMANHAARAIWANMVRGETYRAPAAPEAAAA